MKVTNITASGAILIGGKSKRYNSDKAFINFSGEYLSALLYKRINKILDHVFFVSDKKDKSSIPEAQLVIDLKQNIGPIGGLYTALVNTEYDYCFISACDLPFLSNDLIHLLWKNCDGKNDIIVPVWDSKIEPLAAFYHQRCIPFIETALENKQWMMKGFWDQVVTKYIDVSEHFSAKDINKLFFNINTPGDYISAQEILAMMK
jgi:molybdopterin-guanine dinucleotide biosynthesis protein A